MEDNTISFTVNKVQCDETTMDRQVAEARRSEQAIRFQQSSSHICLRRQEDEKSRYWQRNREVRNVPACWVNAVRIDHGLTGQICHPVGDVGRQVEVEVKDVNNPPTVALCMVLDLDLNSPSCDKHTHSKVIETTLQELTTGSSTFSQANQRIVQILN
jgi:hypothetical protein